MIAPLKRGLSTSTTLLFSTPLYQTDVLSRLTEARNFQLARTIRQAFFRSRPISEAQAALYRHEAANRECADPAASAANNEFFQAQIDGLVATPTEASVNLAAPAFARCAAFAELAKIVRSSAQDFAQAAYGLSPAAAAALVAPRRLFLWASVHAGGSAHPPHTHRDAIVSGVYYVDAPEGSGDFCVGPPASTGSATEHRVKPAAGTLVLFPSQTPHQVESSGCAAERPRLSVSFNLEGAWDEAPAARVVLTAAPTTTTAPQAAAFAATVEPADDVAVPEADAADLFAQMAARLMKDPARKRPAGMPERKRRGS